MRELILALFAGVIVGIVFKFIKLPLPAPPVLPGVIGIVGVYLGGVAGSWILQQFFQG
ncbi:XapX domain-containing protein [Mesobacillus maritimus]|uniref:XapX domain-containing protein n=1 Tax=Mesobacillus maritimus TaxID=1643336 RepID=UPI00384C4CB5